MWISCKWSCQKKYRQIVVRESLFVSFFGSKPTTVPSNKESDCGQTGYSFYFVWLPWWYFRRGQCDCFAKNELLINAMSLLFISIGELCELTKNYLDTSKILFFLTESVNGERFDFYSTLSEDSSAEVYFSKMLQKSTPLVQLVFYLACPDNELIWKDCAQNLSTAFQLQNDALDCMDTSKSDLVYSRKRFPL